MRRWEGLRAGTLAGLLLLAGCASGVATTEQVHGAPGGVATHLTQEQLLARLTFETQAQRVEGTFVLPDATQVTFTSAEQPDHSVEVTLRVHDMTLEAVIDPALGVSSLDAFATATGRVTQVLPEDRAAVLTFYEALNARLPESQQPTPALMLRRVAGLWAQHPNTMDPVRLVMGAAERSWTMLCSYALCGSGGTNGGYTGTCATWRYFNYADHDCCRNWYGTDCHNFGDGDGRNQQRAQIGDHGTCSGDEIYWNGSAWVCGEPNHWSRPYVRGICWGRCGASCGGDTQYTLDATHHDGCVRNGHDLASAYCNDQFGSASDDELYAPNCY